MPEYSRILIEEYCATHKSKRSRQLERLVEASYDLSYEGTDEDAFFLDKAIEQEKNPDLKEAIQDLRDFILLW